MADNFWPIAINPMALGADESTLPGGAGWENANLLPIQKNRKTGQWAWGMPNSLAAALSGIMAPGKAANGLYERMIDPTTGVNYYDGMLGDVSNLAGMLTLGGGAIPKPKGSLGIFGGEMALTADKTALETAKKMAADGANRDEIWNATGWFKGKDDKWRFEIPDNASAFNPKAIPDAKSRMDIADEYLRAKGYTDHMFPSGDPRVPREQRNAAFAYADENMFSEKYAPETNVGAALSHDPLFQAYPDAAKISLAKNNMGGGWLGSYDGEGRITIGGEGVIGRTASSPHSTLLHELQHVVQTQEGFGRGGNTLSLAPGTPAWDVYREISKKVNTPLTREEFRAQVGEHPDYPYETYLKQHKENLKVKGFELDRMAQETAVQEAYKRMAGEVEARNVQARMGLTPEQRRAKAPWKTQDVPDELQIVRMRGN